MKNIFCLIAMLELDDYQYELREYWLNHNYDQYLTTYANVNIHELHRFVRVYKYYYRQLVYVEQIVFYHLTNDQLNRWKQQNYLELHTIKLLLTSFINDSHRFSIHFDENPGEYQELVERAKKIKQKLKG